MEENLYEDLIVDGKIIIAKISVEGQIYYIDETREIYEKANNVFYIVTDERIRESVKNILYKKSDNFMI